MARDLPGGSVVGNPPNNAGDMGSIPGPGGFCLLWGNWAHAHNCSRARSTLERVLCNEKPPQRGACGLQLKHGSCALQLEKSLHTAAKTQGSQQIIKIKKKEVASRSLTLWGSQNTLSPMWVFFPFLRWWPMPLCFCFFPFPSPGWLSVPGRADKLPPAAAFELSLPTSCPLLSSCLGYPELAGAWPARWP